MSAPLLTAGFFAARTMEMVGTLTMPDARRYLGEMLMLMPLDCSAVEPLRELHLKLTEAEEHRRAVQTGHRQLRFDFPTCEVPLPPKCVNP